MKQIPLSQGKFALVDDEDYDFLMQWKWHYGAKYARISPQNKQMGRISYMHRVIMNPPENMLVDHINGNRLDNRKCNLRICTKSGNEMNADLQSNNTSGFKGVFWDEPRKKYRVNIGLNGKNIFLGRYDNLIDAAIAYNKGALKYHGEFALLNKIPD